MTDRRTNPAANDSAIAVVDAIDDEHGRVSVAPNDGRVHVHGWVLDANAESFAAVEIGVGGARASAPCTRSRPDVAAIYGSPERVGYHVELALDDAAAGHHAVTMHGVRADGSRVRIPVTATLDVVPPLRRLPKESSPARSSASSTRSASRRPAARPTASRRWSCRRAAC